MAMLPAERGLPKALLPAAFASLALFGWAHSAAALPPWARSLSAEQEAELLDEARSELDESLHRQLDVSIANGMLIAAGDCVSSGTVHVDEFGLSQSGWIGAVESVATIAISNLSDSSVWRVEVDITGVLDAQHSGGIWHANLPYLPPHSQAELVIGCARSPHAQGPDSTPEVVNELRSAGIAGPLTAKLAAQLAREPAAYQRGDHFQSLAWSSEEAVDSLAAGALPHIEDPEQARLLLAEVLAQTERWTQGDPLTAIDHGALLAWLPASTPAATEAILEALILDPETKLEPLLDHIVRLGKRELDGAADRVAAEICTNATSEQRIVFFIEQLASTHPRRWKSRLFEACPLTAEEFDGVIAALLRLRSAYAKERTPTSRNLATLLELAPMPRFEQAVATLLGPEGEANPEPRPLEFWVVLARLSADESERGAALEALLRPHEVGAAGEVLLFYEMTPLRLARLDRVVAKLDALPVTERGALIEPLFQSALAANELEAPLLERMIALAQVDSPRLRPLMLAALATTQSVLSPEAVARLPQPHAALLDHFRGPGCFAATTLDTLEHCAELFADDPEFAAALALPGALRTEFLDHAATVASLDDPTPQQRAIILALRGYGLPITAIATRMCARAEALEADGDPIEAHMEFLAELASDQACVLDLQARHHRAKQIKALWIAAAMLASSLVFLAGLRWRRRQAKLFESG